MYSLVLDMVVLHLMLSLYFTILYKKVWSKTNRSIGVFSSILSVHRNALWHKLFEAGMSCRMVNIFKCHVLNWIGTCSMFWRINWTQTGWAIIPFVFHFLYLWYCGLDSNHLDENDQSILSFYLILFTDDIVLFTTNPKTIQLQIDNVYRYSLKLGLKGKNKSLRFSQRLSPSSGTFVYEMERVTNFEYLILSFSYNDNLMTAVKRLHDQALKHTTAWWDYSIVLN